jgi:hypothetical protein
MQPVFISSSDKGSDKIRLGDRYERFLKGLPHKQEVATPQEEHLRLAMTTDRPRSPIFCPKVSIYTLHFP